MPYHSGPCHTLALLPRPGALVRSFPWFTHARRHRRPHPPYMDRFAALLAHPYYGERYEDF